MTNVYRNLLRLVFSFLILGIFVSPQSAKAADEVAILAQVQGEVFLQKVGTTDWTPVSTTTELQNGDAVKTGNGTGTLVYTNQATFVMEANTSLIVKNEADTQDIHLTIGKIRGKVEKGKVTKPFQLVTPTAVGAVRGTEVDFEFDTDGKLTIDLHNGNVQVYNEANMTMDLDGGKKISVEYDAEAGELRVSSDCSSSGDVSFSVLGASYSVAPCGVQVIKLDTGAGGQGNIPDDNVDNDGENEPNENTTEEDPGDDAPAAISPITT